MIVWWDKIVTLLQKNKWAPRAVLILLLLLLLNLGYQTFSIVREPLKLLPLLQFKGGVHASKPTLISEWHLMGQFQGSLQDLPETRLQLTLQGTEVSLESASLSHAIISSPDKKAKSYSVGDSVPGGAVITKIQQNRIIIKHEGRLEQLKMPVHQLQYSSPKALQLQTVE